jgi:ribonucleoside-diphosphate reductase alpha chain
MNIEIKTKKIKIKDAVVGTYVRSFNIEQDRDQYCEILYVHDPIVTLDNQVKIDTESGASLITSKKHPIMYMSPTGWNYKPTSELQVGETCNSLGGGTTVTELSSPNTNTRFKDLTVDVNNNFYAGIDPDKMIVAHNSATVNIPIWHYQFDDFIVLKNNQGTEENRVRHLDYCVALSALFWRRFKQNGVITFFDPNEVPDLYEAFYSDIELFEELYVKYENTSGLRTKTVSAVTVFKDWLLKERSDTGRIYLLYIDNVINHTPFDSKTHPIYQTNLCAEILLSTQSFERIDDEKGRIALCTLGSMNIGKFRHPAEMEAPAKNLVRALSNVLGYQEFLGVQASLANEEFEPLGIGITNLAYWHAKRGLKYGSPEALALVKSWMEHLAFYLTEATVQLAKERGPCKLSHTTSYGKGIFPWEKRADGVNELTDFTPSLDWEPLRKDMITYGVRNATLMAIAPVESSSVVIDSTNGIELPMQLISIKESKAGSLIQVVPEYAKLKAKYQLMWDQTDCIDYIKTAAVLSVYVDQSISTNTFYSPKHFPDGKVPTTLVAKNLMLAHKWGIRTFYYSLMDKQGAKAVIEDSIPAISVSVEEEYCDNCVL